ncbi:hypothetical protein [Campylobacter canadensis]|uniref:hypothetical protein n=1 Tax=Campylobacter canadensis TaxID=449520 RepID=UPI001CCFBB7E|nr:hypothetical protein [Campylobacter canadensis]MBZ8002388.1 hypothetical protein [Campylobacter canadensis]
MKNNKIFFLIFILAVSLYAANSGDSEGLTNLNQAGASAKTTAVKAFQNWKWIFAFIPLGVAGGAAFTMNHYIEKKEEQNGGQSEPKASKYFKIVISSIIAIVVCFIIYGTFGSTFGGMGYWQTWDTLVIQTFKEFMGVTNGQ